MSQSQTFFFFFACRPHGQAKDALSFAKQAAESESVPSNVWPLMEFQSNSYSTQFQTCTFNLIQINSISNSISPTLFQKVPKDF